MSILPQACRATCSGGVKPSDPRTLAAPVCDNAGQQRFRGPARSGVGRAAPGKGSRQVEASNSRGASQLVVASGGAVQPALQQLVDVIIQLGHMPKQSKNASVEEKRLAVRLAKARKAGSLTTGQGAVLGNLAQASGASQPASKTGEILQ